MAKPIDSLKDFGKPDVITFLTLTVLGLVVWVVTAWITGVSEAWDAPKFNTVAVPIMAGFVFFAGIVRPYGFWLWGIAVSLLHPVALLCQPNLGAGVPMILPGIIALALYTAVYTFAAAFGAIIRWSLSKWKHSPATGETPKPKRK